MAEMRLVVAGAGGRMGQTLIRLVAQAPDVVLAGAIERAGSPALGQDFGPSRRARGERRPGDRRPPRRGRSRRTASSTSPRRPRRSSSPAWRRRCASSTSSARRVSPRPTRAPSGRRPPRRHRQVGQYEPRGQPPRGAGPRASRATLDEDFDIEIVEMHHRRKVDAPSGTALLLGRGGGAGARRRPCAALAARARRAHRARACPATSASPRCAAAASSAITRVIFAGEGERIELTHQAEDRAIFARGALKAVRWGRGRKPGLYGMADVLGLGEAGCDPQAALRGLLGAQDGMQRGGIARRRAASARSSGSRRARAMRDKARRWSAPAVSGASSRKTRSTGWPSIASKSIGRSSRANSPKMRGRRPSLPCGMAMPLPTPVEPRRSRCSRMSKISRSPIAGKRRGPLGDLLQNLLLGVHLQRRNDRVQRKKIAQGHHGPRGEWCAATPDSGRGALAQMSSIRPRRRRRR